MLLLVSSTFFLSLVNDCTGVPFLRHSIGRRDNGVADVIFTDDLLWTTTCRSKTDCAVSCMADLQCVSFTISPVIPNGKRACRGHSSATVSRSPSRVSSPGTRLYILQTTTPAIVQNTSPDSTAVETTVTEDQPVITSTVATTTTHTPVADSRGPEKDIYRRSPFEVPPLPDNPYLPRAELEGWLQKACTTDPECPTSNSRCFSGKCLCTPGYYFSKSTKTCVSACPLGSLLQEVVEYPMWYIFGHNDGGASATTYNACLSACLGDVNCRSFDYRYNGDICSTSYKDALDVPAGDWRPSTTSDQLYYYQRVCA